MFFTFVSLSVRTQCYMMLLVADTSDLLLTLAFRVANHWLTLSVKTPSTTILKKADTTPYKISDVGAWPESRDPLKFTW